MRRFLLALFATAAVFAQELPVAPSVLLLKWKAHCGLDHAWMEELQQAGFTVDFTDTWEEVTWDRLAKYNVLVLFSLPHVAEGETRGITGLATDGPGPDETLAMLDRYLAAGGGILYAIHRPGQNPTLYHTTDQALARWGARLPLELIAAPVTNTGWHQRLRMEFMYTANVDPDTPVSAGVQGIWWPNPPKGRMVNYVRYAGPLVFDDQWQVVVRAPAGSRTYPYVHPRAGGFPEALRLTDALQRPEGVSEPPLFGIRQVGPGRLAAFHALNVFHMGSGTTWMHGGAMLDKGLRGKPSDFGKLLVNTLRWLSEPSLAAGKLGGAEVDPLRVVPEKLRPDAVAKFTDAAQDPRRIEWDPTAPPVPTRIFRGLIGARSAYGGGQGTAADYAAAAKAAGLDFVIFLDPFAELTPAELESLRADCAATTDDQVLLMAGYRMDSNIGNRMFFYGLLPTWPDPIYMSHRGPHLFRLQGEEEDGTFSQRDMGLSFLIKDFMGREKARVTVNNIGYFDFARAAERGGLQPEHCKAYGAMGVMFYENGKLQEDVTDRYLLTNASTMTSLPVVVNLVNSPAELTASVARGDAMTCVATAELADLPERLNKNHQFESPPVFASSGPEIRQWPQATRPFVYGNELFVNSKGLLDCDLHVTSTAGLAEVAIYDGPRLFRRYLPGGAKDFHQRLYLSAFMQRHLAVVATDTAGGHAVGFPILTRKPSSEQAVSFCGDHVNHCTSAGMKMAHGPNYWRAYNVPMQANAGHTWDGGPPASQELAAFDMFAPDLRTAAGDRQNETPYQHPVMVFGSERVYRGRSVLDGVLRTPGNPWRGWGPIYAPSVYRGESTYTEFGRYMTGVDPTAWGGPGAGGGTVAGLYEQDIEFVQDAVIKQFRLTRGRRDNVPGLRSLLLVGQGETLLGAYDFTRDDDAGGRLNVHIPAGGWFAGIVTAGAANDFLCFTQNQPLDLDVVGEIADISVALPPAGLKVQTGDHHRLSLLTYVWPMDISLGDSDAVLAVVRYLAEPWGLKLMQGEQAAPALPGLLDLSATDGVVEFGLAQPKPGTVTDITPAVRVQGLNPRWSAGFWQHSGYGGAQYYSDGRNQYAPLGVDEQGRTYTPVYSLAAKHTHWFVGHPIVASETGRDLFIQVTPLVGPMAGKGFWHVAVNNPTDAPVTTVLRRRFDLPGLAFTEAEVTLAPGESRILEHDLPPVAENAP